MDSKLDQAESGNIAGQVLSAVDKTGLPKTIKGRLQRIAFRILAGGIAHPYFRQIRDNLDEIEGRSKVNAMIAEEVGRQAIRDPAIIERAKARLLGEALIKQENLEAVLIKAHEDIDAHDQIEENDNQSDPSLDWINTFTREAENASSDELRERLAKILSSEIKSPGSVSRSTIRIMAELDREIIEKFIKVLPNRVGTRIITEDHYDTGEFLNIGVDLETAGLVFGSAGLTSAVLAPDESGQSFLLGNEFALTLVGENNVRKTVSAWLLSRTGTEIADLLTNYDEKIPLRKVAEKIDKTGLQKIYIGACTKCEALFNVNFDEVVWQI